MEENLKRTAITFLIGGLILGFCIGVFLVTNFGLFLDQNENIGNECMFELGENVSTDEDYFETMGFNFTGTVIEIRHDTYRNVLCLYNVTNEELLYVPENCIDGYDFRKYESLIN